MRFDIAIIGAGIAGASAAYFLAPRARVVVLERESQPGYHTTGRSAALFTETYGNAQIRAMTRASRSFLETPPPGFTDTPILAPRGMLFFGRADHRELLDAHAAEILEQGGRIERPGPAEVLARVPALRPEWAQSALLETDAEDIDVHALLSAYLRSARAAGAQIMTDAGLEAASRERDGWRLRTRAGEVRATTLVNAAGAWADEVAGYAGAAPLGLAPLRRTAIVFEAPQFNGARDWPMACDATEDLYFRPESGGFLASPADETPSPPCDAQPEELDIAQLIERLQQATRFDVRRITARWAGLRTFAPDRSLVAGFDPAVSGLFWLAGQGGYGIQTSPAMGMLCAALLRNDAIPAPLADQGIVAAHLSPARASLSS